MRIQEYLKEKKILTDGSFGTYYAELYQTNEIPELANTEHPQRVVEIHRAYLRAGAELIRTNTFAANTAILRRDLKQVCENIRASVRLAREAMRLEGKEAFLAGDIGPLPADDEILLRDDNQVQLAAEDQYVELARTFLEEGVYILNFETFSDLEHVLPAIKRIRAEADAFIMVQFCVNQFGYSASGLSARRLLQEAAECPEISAYGLNCGVGPGHMIQILRKAFETIPEEQGKYRIALPNAGYPKRVRSQIRFADNPAYYAEKVSEISDCGPDILGGCCGTNPAFIGALSRSLDRTRKSRRREARVLGTKTVIPVEKGFLYGESGSRKEHKLIAVELAPPLGADDEKLLEAAHLMKREGVDVLTFPDSPSGRTRIDSILMAAKVHQATGMTVMPHLCCRDKNAIAMRSQLLGAHINDIHNLLIITGDPVPGMDRQSVKSVFQFDAVGLMNMVRDMNEENFAGMPMRYGGAISQNRRNLEAEIARVKKKMAAGAEFFLTQPVFTAEDAARVRRIKEETGAVILCGVMPFVNRRNASFMKNEISGVVVPDEIIELYPQQATRQEGEEIGVTLARRVIRLTEDFSDGYYFSFPFNRVTMLSKIYHQGSVV